MSKVVIDASVATVTRATIWGLLWQTARNGFELAVTLPHLSAVRRMSRTINERAPARADLVLYGTLGCHLCDRAMALTLPVARRAGATLAERDIAADPALEARYGIRIPVLHRRDNGAELDWPFDAAAVYRLTL